MKNTAALYLRSSKDRKDVSPAAQRRELQALAKARGLTIVEEFCDVVASGKTENRPGFQALLRALGAKDRAWSSILMLDTSRLARNQYVAHFFSHECKRRDIEVVFAKTPEMDGIAGILLPAILHAVDEVHSYMSREKGLAGMAENVRSGYRAGGRAPTGYRLKKIPTGAVREGEAVTKSVLELDPDRAEAMGRYLSDRAAGIGRSQAKRTAGIEDLANTTLIGIEWNALVYAGHTVWNVHAERQGGAYVGGHKRRPRSEWVIQRDTHPALISDADAEQLLSRLEVKSKARKQAAAMQRDRESTALLGGLLFAPDGTKWWAESDRYRMVGKGGSGQRSIARSAIEEPVVDQVLEQLASADFAQVLLSGAQAALAGDIDTKALRKLRAEVTDLVSRISRTMDLAAELADPAPALRKVDELEHQRAEKVLQLQELELEAQRAQQIAEVSIESVQQLLAEISEQARESDRDGLRSTLVSLVERVELDPQTLDATLYYRITSPALEPGVKVASPRGFEPLSPP